MNPLEGFYHRAGAPAPKIEALSGAQVPQPYHRLLVHELDMTSTLEAFVAQPLQLRILQTCDEPDHVCREVVLVGERDGIPAEFGAIRIWVDRLDSAEAQREVREGRQPLGGILRRHGIAHRCRPTGFFRVGCDHVMRDALGLDGGGPLYGRHNLLFDAGTILLAEVTEILPLFGPVADRAS